MKDSFKYQTAADQAAAAAYLRALAEGIERGEIRAAENEHSFTLTPRGLLSLTLKIRRKEGKSRVHIDIAWADDDFHAPLFDNMPKGGS